MNLERAFRVLIEQWGDVGDRFSADSRLRLAELVRRVADGVEAGGDLPADAANAMYEIYDLLHALLPDEHPVLLAFEGTRSATKTTDLSDTARLLLGHLTEDGGDRDPTPEEIAHTATRMLLSAPALTRDELADYGLRADEPGLIRLRRLDGGYRWPEFQFGADGRPIELVVRINLLLGVEDDPWGVADWWLGANLWLRDVPARLVGRIPDEQLMAAARAVDPGV